MRVVIQRVTEAKLEIGGKLFSKIGRGMLVLVGVESGDTDDDLEWIAGKTAGLRIFGDENGLMNRSLSDIGGEVMAVSQFTLMASTRKGKRPSFIRAAAPDEGRCFYEKYCERLEQLLGASVKRGCFGADMQITFCNDGPVTIIIDSRLRE